ncbi:hypothetical protein B9Z55_025152 [Caenorhabditis nigoni]|uniref:ZP domain-containing protein n=1 Tax=Caenorhabditis nigoni TaxID=1611254 RepID=A0A2G5SX61_9PELO|nr:hypothetical protein B9Z55_025152 [Caenorhabditis nigoni]
MCIFLVVFIFGIITSVVPTRFNITGTIKCQNAPSWCYTVQLQVLDSSKNDIMDSFAACEFKSSHQDYQLKSMEGWDGVLDGNFETELLIEHNCGVEANEEKQSIRMTFDPISTKTRFVRKEININLAKNEAEIVRTSDKYRFD